MNSNIQKLDRNFYLRPTLEVAQDLIGKHLVYNNNGKIISVRLVEVEAYIGEDDPACHAAVGKTARNEIMFGIGGFSYIYFIYGMYHCLNIVTERKGFPAAILIRGAEPIEGIEIMQENYPNAKKAKKAKNWKYTNGPGKLCKALGLTRKKNGLDLTGNSLYLENRDYKVKRIKSTERIGIKKGTKRKWRFYDSDSESVTIRKR